MSKPMSSLQVSGAAVALAFAWLLPNHSMPWLGFHGDAWAASCLLAISIYVFYRFKSPSEWHFISILAAAIVCIPLLQFVTHLIPIFGVAWINAAYMLGFLLAILVGSTWEKSEPNQCSDFLFLSIAIASTVSIGLQLHQFFNLENIGPWILNSTGSRHFANMAQPNQLASLLLLGSLACGWGYWRKFIGPYTAIGVAGLFLFGTVLTESRTAWLNVFCLVGCTVFWRKVLPSKTYLWCVFGLAVFFALCAVSLSANNDFFGGGLPVQYRSTTADPRWTAWVMFLKAIAYKPMVGFGWGQLGYAQFLMMDEKISLGGSFLQAHNLFIDLMLWNGIPLGLGISATLVWWVWSVIRSIRNFSQYILTCFLLILGIHAMLEYPLQYAYFLLPVGFVMGSLNTSMGFRSIQVKSRWPAVVVLLSAAVVLFITVRDYFRIEDSFYGLRFEQKKIQSDYPRTPPDVMALTQWRDYIVFARMEPRPGIATADLEWMRNLVSTTPSAFVMYKFAAMLAFNDQPAEAATWLKRLCLTSPREHCEAIRIEWAKQSEINQKYASIAWPN
jgi:hypothetical protein